MANTQGFEVLPVNPTAPHFQRLPMMSANVSKTDRLERYRALVGEAAWHSITVDPTIAKVSEEHFHIILDLLSNWGPKKGLKGLRILEVASYAHTTGYRLAELGAYVTLFEISAQTLEYGRKMAEDSGITGNVRLVVGDFHELPFADGTFDFVYISSALHHTWRWKELLNELVRVVAPEGLLFFKNEPCQRAACFYGFRTNREYALTPFEKKLQELGALTTFAEPFLGSRPEMLFGMIENQRMPLQDILAELDGRTDRVKLELTPQIGPLERRWLDAQLASQSELTHIVRESLWQARTQALELFTEVERGLGFSLPNKGEIERFAKQLAQRLKLLPGEGKAQQMALADLFGASLRMLLRKRDVAAPQRHLFGAALRMLLRKRGVGTPQRRFTRDGHPPLCKQSLQHNGLHYTLAPDLSKMLMERASSLPSIQEDSPEKVATAFPAPLWTYAIQPNGVKAVVLNSPSGEIHIPAKSGDMLVIVRFHVGAAASGGYRVSIRCRKEELFAYEVWQGESILFSHLLNTEGNKVVLIVERQPLSDHGRTANVGPVVIPLAVALAV